jgi:hypothetical protein
MIRARSGENSARLARLGIIALTYLIRGQSGALGRAVLFTVRKVTFLDKQIRAR